jgi:hypothetical protein
VGEQLLFFVFRSVYDQESFAIPIASGKAKNDPAQCRDAFSLVSAERGEITLSHFTRSFRQKPQCPERLIGGKLATGGNTRQA